MLEAVFLISIGAILYAYFGYPLSLSLLAFVWKRDVKRAEIYPEVTIIIAVHNEEKRIRKKLENTLEVEYPRHKLQIIVSSDGSTDRTNEIVKEYEAEGIELLALSRRQGKEAAQGASVRRARGEVLVFTDVATIVEPEVILRIVSNFADPSVGCVSSEDRLVGNDGKPSGEGLYVRYEMWLRTVESRANSLVGVSGSFFAARKEVCRDFSNEMQSDFRTVLNSVKMGLRAVSDPQAVGYYRDVIDRRREFDRKVRTVLRGLTVFFSNLEFLNFVRYGIFSYQYLCHKLLRWMVPVFLCTSFVSNLLLVAGSSFYALLLAAQGGFYCLAFLGFRGSQSSGVLYRIPAYFLTVNYSIFVAWIRYIKGERMVLWTPSER